jgi:NADP-dependent 3-hydroxy acid dehydrogenase YdfG
VPNARRADAPRTVFITGASSGIGAALASRYAAQGANVGVFARRATELDRVVSGCAKGRVVPYVGDVRDAALERAAPVVARFGALTSSSPTPASRRVR